LTTQEFFADVSRALEPDGRMFYNFIGVPEGDKSNSFRAISTTLASVFNDARASEVSGERLMNIILVASQVQMEENPFPQAPEDGTLLTDDLNPAEVYFEQARAGYYFH
jgi:spermidine synthase